MYMVGKEVTEGMTGCTREIEIEIEEERALLYKVLGERRDRVGSPSSVIWNSI